jgi:hypothetical protein
MLVPVAVSAPGEFCFIVFMHLSNLGVSSLPFDLDALSIGFQYVQLFSHCKDEVMTSLLLIMLD